MIHQGNFHHTNFQLHLYIIQIPSDCKMSDWQDSRNPTIAYKAWYIKVTFTILTSSYTDVSFRYWVIKRCLFGRISETLPSLKRHDTSLKILTSSYTYISVRCQMNMKHLTDRISETLPSLKRHDTSLKMLTSSYTYTSVRY